MIAGLAFSLLSFDSLASGDCSSMSACERKFCEIEPQI